MIDIFLRGETPAALRTVVKSTPFRNIVGNLTDQSDATKLRHLAGSVDHVYFPPNTVVIIRAVYDADENVLSPATMDAWCWLHLRLSGTAEAADLDDVDDESDRWNRSKLRKWMQNNGTLKTPRGVTVYEHVLGTGKRVQLWRGSEMEAQGVLFHRFQGGNDY